MIPILKFLNGFQIYLKKLDLHRLSTPTNNELLKDATGPKFEQLKKWMTGIRLGLQGQLAFDTEGHLKNAIKDGDYTTIKQQYLSMIPVLIIP